MSQQTENGQINSKLSHWQHVFKDKLLSSKNSAEWIIQRIGNLNETVQETEYLKTHHPEWIGCTPLHLVAYCRKLQAFKILISKGADFTLKNSNGATPLHVAVENAYDNKFTVNNFVNSVLSAHLEYNNYKNPCNQNGLTHFHIACWFNNSELVKQFLKHGVPVNHAVNKDSTFSPGYTPLHFSAKYRCFDVIKILLAHNANTQITDAKGMTPLHIVLEILLEIADPAYNELTKKLQSDINQISANFQIKKLISIVNLFLAHTKNEIATDVIGLSQLHVLCTMKNVKETKRQLGKVENVNQFINLDSPICPGYTALHVAAHFNMDIVKLLLKNGANIEAKDAKGVTPFDICLRRYETLDIHSIILLTPKWKNIVLSDGKTKLSNLVFAMRDADSFKKFLKRLAKNLLVQIPNDSPLWPGFSLIHVAVVLGKRKLLKVDASKLQILEELMVREPALLQRQDIHGWTPLHLAYRMHKDYFVNVLLKHHETVANPRDIADEDGLSLIHIASTQSNELLKKLLSKVENINTVYKGTSFTRFCIYPGATPLHFAVAHNSKDGMETLLQHVADIYAKDANDMTPVHLLIATNLKGYGDADVLLNHPELKDSVVKDVGLSHLHVACLEGYYESAATLVNNGANTHQALTSEVITTPGLSKLNEWRGCTPLEIAFKKGYQDCVDFFIKQDPSFPVKNYRMIYDILSNRYNCFIPLSELPMDEETFAHLKADIGMTKLHFACWEDPSNLEKIVEFSADVNVRIHEDSPIWPGWTPVHVLLNGHPKEQSLNYLLDVGIDVTLSNVDGETIVHMAYRRFRKNSGTEFYTMTNKLLEAQKDFSVNPTSLEGITHFHTACALANAPVVKKFLQHSSNDVNRSIDFFHKGLGGQTPLHLLAGGRNDNTTVAMQLETVELLLKYGIDIHAQNNCGNTALHECGTTYNKSTDLFERIAKEGADVNARNISGHTPIKIFLSEEKISVEEIKQLLRLGCRLNMFNPVTEEGCFGQAFYSMPNKDIKSFISSLETELKDLIETDDKKRTILHNIVSIAELKIPVNKYAAMIMLFSNIGYDIDGRDTNGRTPLHIAVKHSNVKAIVALLLIGVNVDVVDYRGITAFNECSYGCYQCKDIFETASNIDYYENSDENNEDGCAKCRHVKIYKLLAIHIRKLLHCKIDVSWDNEFGSDLAFNKSGDVQELPERFFKELEDLKRVCVEPYSCSVSEFLSENGAVSEYPEMSLAKRNAIREFFLSSNINSFRKKFRETAGIVQLQYRKAVLRVDLLEMAKNSLTTLAGIRLDDLCFQIVFKFLTNLDIRCLIASIN